MQSRELRRLGFPCGREQRIPRAAFRQLKLRAFSQAHIGVSEQGPEMIGSQRAETFAQPRLHFGAQRIAVGFGGVECPDRALLLQRITAGPIGEIQFPIRSPAHADAHDAAGNRHVLREVPRRAVRGETQRVHFSRWKLVQEKPAAPRGCERGAGIECEARGTVVRARERRGDEERLRRV